MIGKRFNKPLSNKDSKEYADMAMWCSENGATIYDRGTYYEVAPVVVLESDRINSEIAILKRKLRETDYQAIKASEGITSQEEYAPIKAQRQSWREEINTLEAQLKQP